MQIRNLINKNILITGGAGFIAQHLISELVNSKVKKIIVLDNLFIGKAEYLDKFIAKNRCTYYNVDIENFFNLYSIFKKHKIDHVFNLATKPLNYSFTNPANAFDTNTKALINLLEIQRQGMFDSLGHFSTSEVFGTAKIIPMNEDHPKNPTTTYAAGKLAADALLKTYVSMFGLDCYIVRPFNNFGPFQNYKGSLAAVIPLTAHRIFNKLSPIIHGSGNQVRDFIYVVDTVKAIIKVHQCIYKGDDVNIATNNPIKIKDVINLICKYYNYKGPIIKLKDRASDVKTHVACNKKLKKMIQFKETNFKIALSETLNWYDRIFISSRKN
jgi:UDP-glucose 4-epimerase